jgi:hypothetical protein
VDRCELRLDSISIYHKGKFSLCLTNQALRHEDVWESGYIDTQSLDLSTIWRWVVSIIPRPLYPPGEGPRYRMDRLSGPPGPLWTTWRRENLAPALTWTRTPLIVQSVASLYMECVLPAPVIYRRRDLIENVRSERYAPLRHAGNP